MDTTSPSLLDSSGFSRANRTPGFGDIGPELDPCVAVFGVFVNFLANFPQLNQWRKRRFPARVAIVPVSGLYTGP